MFDTMTVTKTAAALFGALLVLLLGKWVAEELYDTGIHGEASYVIDTGEEEPEEEVVEVSFDELLASADAGKGERVFKKCAACHKLEQGANSTGPYLYGVVGRPVAAVDGFGYSDAMASEDGEWTAEHLDAFLTKPSDVVPGTSMSFSGLKKQADRVNLIAFLNDNSDAPVDFAAAGDASDGAEEDTETVVVEPVEIESTPAPTTDSDTEATEVVEVPAETSTETPAATEEPEAEESAEAPAATEEPAAEESAEAPAATETEEAPAETEMALAGDPEAGEKVFKKCKACHKLEEGRNGVGPHLYDVVGRPVASVEGFRYSSALQEIGGDWTPEKLDGYLLKPRDFAKGTKMSFSGLRKQEDRDDVIAYLNSIGD